MTIRLLALPAALLLLAACNGSQGKPAPTAVPDPQSSAVTTAAKTPTTAPLTAPPPSATLPTTIALPNTSGPDLVTVMQNLSLLLNLASERVDLSLLDVIYTPDAQQRQILEKQLRYLLDNGWHYDDSERSKVTDITVQTPLEGVAVVELTSSQGKQVLKDASGQVVKTGEGWSPRRERYGLFRGTDGRWRIRDASLLGPA